MKLELKFKPSTFGILSVIGLGILVGFIISLQEWIVLVIWGTVFLVNLLITLSSFKRTITIELNDGSVSITSKSIMGKNRMTFHLSRLVRIYYHQQRINFIPTEKTIKGRFIAGENNQLKELELLFVSGFTGYLPNDSRNKVFQFLHNAKPEIQIGYKAYE